MTSRPVALGLLLLLLGLILPRSLAGQPQGRCLPVLPGEVAALASAGVGSPGSETNTGLFVSHEGSLCRALTPPSASTRPSQSILPETTSPARAFLLSVLLPGWGQREQGSNRWVAYLAAEVWAWIQFVERRREGKALQREYRDLAWSVARRVSSGPRKDGSFEYYEAMTEFVSSGAYDLDPDGFGVQPETNEETYNGTIWLLARQIFFLDDPDNPVEEDSRPYQKAIRYYLSRAYTPDLAWNWSSSPFQQAEFASLIRSSDENLRRSTTMIGVILANHLLSAVDALVTGRIRESSSPGPSLETGIRAGPDGSAIPFISLRLTAF